MELPSCLYSGPRFSLLGYGVVFMFGSVLLWEEQQQQCMFGFEGPLEILEVYRCCGGSSLQWYCMRVMIFHGHEWTACVMLLVSLYATPSAPLAFIGWISMGVSALVLVLEVPLSHSWPRLAL